MPTLIKRPGSPYFIACYDVAQPDGTIRRLKKSTKRTKRAEAMTEAIKLEEAERKGGTATSEQATKAFAVLTQAAEAAARGELSEGRRASRADRHSLEPLASHGRRKCCPWQVPRGEEQAGHLDQHHKELTKTPAIRATLDVLG